MVDGGLWIVAHIHRMNIWLEKGNEGYFDLFIYLFLFLVSYSFSLSRNFLFNFFFFNL